jgi:alanine-synthesizing transaminase
VCATRVSADLAPNRLARVVQERRASGQPLIDLTESNSTRVGLDYPADLLAPLADPRGLRYEPQPFGLASAREAVAADYRRRDIIVSPERVALTASTSEAYSFLFKLLASPGDEVLVPRPSYPLFEHLSTLDGLVTQPYDLEYVDGWSIDFASVERAFSPRSRALLLVSPNNPTGSFVSPQELDRLAAVCAPRQVAIIADEVFADYELESSKAGFRPSILMRSDLLAFGLGGFSKSIGLPQVKLGWIAAAGPADSVKDALKRLELICDTYLSVGTPVQLAAGELLVRGAGIRAQILARIERNYGCVQDAVRLEPSCRVLRAAGGWSVVLQVPTFCTEEDLVVDLVTHAGVLVHPGFFFDFPRESFLVLSLLPAEATFAEGVQRLLARVVQAPKGTQGE